MIHEIYIGKAKPDFRGENPCPKPNWTYVGRARSLVLATIHADLARGALGDKAWTVIFCPKTGRKIISGAIGREE